MKLSVNLKSILLSLLLTTSLEASAKCFNAANDVLKFAAALEGTSSCSGFYITPTTVLTAKHCTSGNPRVWLPNFSSVNDINYRKGSVEEEGGYVPTRVVFGPGDIALLTVPPHPTLKYDDFRCLNLAPGRLAIGGYLVGGVRQNNKDLQTLAFPLVSICENPQMRGRYLECSSASNPGQSGSALIQYNYTDDKFEVLGVASQAMTINKNEVAYRGKTRVTPIYDIHLPGE
ncbi:serine protease [Bdellovibrio bacteriovorus]|uniref:S1 family peptidase n=1 Tax=Bdellovibrio bacteriovorus TaxID=959 RepID=UPI0035A72CA7